MKDKDKPLCRYCLSTTTSCDDIEAETCENNEDIVKSTREQALEWWNNIKSLTLRDQYTEKHFNYRPAFSLTGKEIEEMWRKETQPNFNAIDRDEDRSAAWGFGTGKPNQKQFREFNGELFKAYADKFSQEDKIKMLQWLASDLMVLGLIDKSLRP